MVIAQVAEQRLGSPLHVLGPHLAHDHQQHGLGLIVLPDIGPQILAGEGLDGLGEADDRPAVGHPRPDEALGDLDQTAIGVVAAPIQFGKHHLAFGFQLFRGELGPEDHILDDVESEPPTIGRQVHLEDGFVEAGGGVELAAGAFHVRGHLAGRTPLGGLEDHMLEQMAESRLLRGLIPRSGMDEEPDGHQGKAVVLHRHHGEAIGKLHHLGGLGRQPLPRRQQEPHRHHSQQERSPLHRIMLLAVSLRGERRHDPDALPGAGSTVGNFQRIET